MKDRRAPRGVPSGAPSGATGSGPRNTGERSALEDLAHRVRGAASLLEVIAHHPSIPCKIQNSLDLVSSTLDETADRAKSLIEEIGIDLTEQLGITTDDLATMHFSPAQHPFHRSPATPIEWMDRADSDFAAWGEVERILGQDDVTLETQFMADIEGHMQLVDTIEAMHSRAQTELKQLEATLLRLAVAVARKERFED